MGCAMSFGKHDHNHHDDVLVSVCRERKKLMKSAVDRRYALAIAHSKYNQSLYAVGLALRLFVSRHSGGSPLLITYPTEPEPAIKIKEKEIKKTGSDSEEGIVCEHFYDDTGVVGPTPLIVPAVKMTSADNMVDDFGGGWDYFDPFDQLLVNDGGDAKVMINDVAVGGGNEGINDVANGGENEQGRELLEALRQVEEHFLKAYQCGLEFSKLLEFNNNVRAPLEHLDFKESSERFMPSIAWHKSTITRSPSCRSLLSSSSRSSWTGFNSSSDIFDETGGMESGSHLSTLGRLYAWEKKLYDEAKAGYELKKIYDRKSSQLSNKKASSKPGIEDEVNDLYSRVLVSIKICDSISKRIEKVRDNELQPQLIELLHGLTKTWKIMLESHKTQSRIMFEVKTFTCTVHTNDRSRHLATLQLEAEIENWRTCFSSYMASTEAYIEALSDWAYRTIGPENEFNIPPLVFTMCRNWLLVMQNLPDKAVTYAMKRFKKDLRNLWSHQEIEQQQKRKVDRLIAESGKRVVTFEREERNIVNSRTLNVKNKVDGLAARKVQLDGFTKMVEIEKAKLKDCVEGTRRVILVGFQTGFASVFDSLTEFIEVCVRKYDDLARNVTSGTKLIHGR